MSIMTTMPVRAHRAGDAAMLAAGHRAAHTKHAVATAVAGHVAWQDATDTYELTTFVVETFHTSTVSNPKGTRAWRPPSA